MSYLLDKDVRQTIQTSSVPQVTVTMTNDDIEEEKKENISVSPNYQNLLSNDR